MALQATPATLADVWNLPVGAFNPGMRQFEQMQQADQGILQRLASEEAYKQQERPLTLAQLAGQNRNRDAELPGIVARGKIAGLQADEELAKYDQKLSTWFAENKDKVNKTHFESAMRAGPMMQQLAEMAAYNPQTIPRIRDIMTSQGLGDYWNPQWDNASPQDVSAGLYDFGNALTSATPTMQKLLEQLTSKENIAADKNASAERMAALRAQTAREVAAMRKAASGGKKGGGDIKKLEQLAAGLRARAMTETDPETKAMLVDNYNDVMSDMWKLKSATAQLPKVEVDPSVAPGVLSKPAPKENPFSGAKADPLGIR